MIRKGGEKTAGRDVLPTLAEEGRRTSECWLLLAPAEKERGIGGIACSWRAGAGARRKERGRGLSTQGEGCRGKSVVLALVLAHAEREKGNLWL